MNTGKAIFFGLALTVAHSPLGYAETYSIFDNKYFYNSPRNNNLLGLKPGDSYSFVINRLRDICGGCRIMKEINPYWVHYSLEIKGEMISANVSMAQEKGRACRVSYLVIGDEAAARDLVVQADAKFGARSSYSNGNPEITLEYSDDMKGAKIEIKNDDMCEVRPKVKL
jgi:hypothetical protein